MAETAATGQGAPAAGVQPSANGASNGNGATPASGQGGAQGQPTTTNEGQFNWGLFPDVPEAQRELLQPHLQKVQGYTTQLEQRYAPYQGLMQAVPAGEVENLIGFINAYSNNPGATVLGMLQQERDAGNITPEQLQELVGTTQEQQVQQPGIKGEQVPQWAQELKGELDARKAAEQQETEARQEAEQQAALDQAKTNILAQLTQSGIPEGIVTDEMVVAAIIANNGDEQAATNMFSSLRDGFLGAFTNGKTAGGQAPQVQGQLPQTPKGAKPRRGDDFGNAKVGAKQFLEQQMGMAARG